ncbi:hypothetical protein [Mesomycoplasma ovipneumoniae]|uniref:hypothetical protein n=1 Tax=Mesomycoplasma ovipneumoniae TaxID=29562 RepID=UPI001F0B190A|nr:hypothetical protein [Mesomycoplasma ovipneumoniae]
MKKNKVLLLSTSFLALPTLLISCIHPYQELQKQISKSLVPPQGSYNPKTADPVKGSPILEENSEIISNSVLGFNGQKKNPKEAKNRFDVTKNYTEEIADASFVSGKYGLLPYWYYLQSIPKYLENKGFGTRQYNKEEYLKRLDYFYGKIREYFNRNLVDYQSRDNPGEAEAWKQGLRNQFEKSREAQKSKLNYTFYEDLTDKDKVVEPTQIKTRTYLPIIKPELDRYNAQIPNDESIKYAIVFDFLLANERIWPSSVDKTAFANTRYLDKARLFRDDYYIEKGYNPSEPEKLWYELGWFMLRVQRIISSANATRNILEIIYEIEKGFFELTDKNKDIDYQLVSELDIVGNFRDALEKFLTPGNHLNLRKDLVFNIDISNNQDDQSIISDFIDYYNQKIAPIIWRINLKRKAEDKILTLTKLLKNRNDNNYYNTYLKPLLPEIKDFRDEEDIKNDPTIPEDKKDEAKQGVKKAGIKAWGEWLKTYQQKYGIQFKPDDKGIDNEDFDHESLSSVARPQPVQSNSSNNTENNTQQTTEQTEKTQEQTESSSQN